MLVLKPRLHGIATAHDLQQACKGLKQVLLERHPIKVLQSELRAFAEDFKKPAGNRRGSVFLEKCHWKLPDDFFKSFIHLDLTKSTDKALVHWASVVYVAKHCGTHFESFFYENLIGSEAGFQRLLDTIGAPEGSSAKLARKELDRDAQVS